jgi:hypothetical protein
MKQKCRVIKKDLAKFCEFCNDYQDTKSLANLYRLFGILRKFSESISTDFGLYLIGNLCSIQKSARQLKHFINTDCYNAPTNLEFEVVKMIDNLKEKLLQYNNIFLKISNDLETKVLKLKDPCKIFEKYFGTHKTNSNTMVVQKIYLKLKKWKQIN